MNIWRINRGVCMNVIFTGWDLCCIAVVTFFGADVGLDVMRDSRYATTSPLIVYVDLVHTLTWFSINGEA